MDDSWIDRRIVCWINGKMEGFLDANVISGWMDGWMGIDLVTIDGREIW